MTLAELLPRPKFLSLQKPRVWDRRGRCARHVSQAVAKQKQQLRAVRFPAGRQGAPELRSGSRTPTFPAARYGNHTERQK